MNELTNRRSELRIAEQATIFIELQAADYDNSAPANILICNSIDLSANGMQIQLDREVPVGSIFRLCVDFSDKYDAVYLVGEVKWIRRLENEYSIGFELFESEQTDIEAWKLMIAKRLAN